MKFNGSSLVDCWKEFKRMYLRIEMEQGGADLQILDANPEMAG